MTECKLLSSISYASGKMSYPAVHEIGKAPKDYKVKKYTFTLLIGTVFMLLPPSMVSIFSIERFSTITDLYECAMVLNVHETYQALHSETSKVTPYSFRDVVTF